MKIIRDGQYLVIKDNPWIYWIFYSIFFIAGILCLYMATTKSPDQTTFLIASFIGIAHISVSISMFVHSPASTIVFDKEKQTVDILHSHILKQKLTSFRVDHLKFIKVTHEKDSDGDPIYKAILQTKDDKTIRLSNFSSNNSDMLEKITDEISMFIGIQKVTS